MTRSLRMQDLLDRKPIRDLDLATHISLKHDYVYFQVSKSASSTVKHHLQKLEVSGTKRKVIDVNNRDLSPHVWPSQLKDDQFLEIIENPAFRKVTFVRNPFARILSCYLHRIVAKPSSASNQALLKVNEGRGGPNITFSEFVRVICDQKSRDQERHWRVQHDDVLFDLVCGWAFIGKVEALSQDLQAMVDILSVDCRHSLSTSVNASPMVTAAQEKLRQYFTGELVDRVVDRYRRDFVVFGYKASL